MRKLLKIPVSQSNGIISENISITYKFRQDYISHDNRKRTTDFQVQEQNYIYTTFIG